MASVRLLVVDDEEAIERVLEDYFGSLGYEVVTARSGREALEQFHPGEFDCVLCDLIMPEMNGMDFLREVRTLDDKSVFFMMTGHPSMDSAIDAIKRGADDYILKPLSLEDVRLKIERAVHVKDMEKSLKKANGLLWALIISIPMWLILGIMFGLIWKRL
jgi:two-component system, NtrC family, nitrogen regulation response regulator NtrX